MARIFEQLDKIQLSHIWRVWDSFKIAFSAFLLISVQAFSQEKIPYKRPPQSIVDLVEAPTTPKVAFSSNGEWMLILENPGLESIKKISEPEIGIAGLRIKPGTNGLSKSNYFTGITLKFVRKGIDIKKEAPAKKIADSIEVVPSKTSTSNEEYSLKKDSIGDYSLVLDSSALGSASTDNVKKGKNKADSILTDSVKVKLKIDSIEVDSLSSDSLTTDSLKLDSTAISSISSSFTGLPATLEISNIEWSPNERQIAFSNSTPQGIELWLADLRSLKAERLTNLYLNDTYGKALTWSPNGKYILAKFIVDDRAEMPKPDSVLAGPIIQENLAKSTPTRGYSDLLKDSYDEALFEYFLTSQLKLVDLKGEVKNIKTPAIIKSFEYSPDGLYILLQTIKKPFSYAVPLNLFPYTVEILDASGKLVKKVCEVPLADNIPTGFDAVIKGPRQFGWRADKSATLFWVEAQDKGNPNVQARLRDIIYTQNSPFTQNKVILAECYLRFNNIVWESDNLAIVTERWWKTRSERRIHIQPGDATFRVNLVDRYYEDTYSDPGTFVTRKNEYKRDVLLEDNSSIFYISEGASPEGDRPMLTKFNVNTKLIDTIFHSAAPYYEKPVFFNNKNFLITCREALDTVPNYYRFKLSNFNHKQLTDFKDPYPQLNGIQKQLLSYKRLDGINLGGTLYLPNGYLKEDGPLPLLMWLNPSNFKTATAAGEIRNSPYKFTKLDYHSPIYWVTRGYAILDNADMPIIGESNKEPNDTFIEQIRYNAEAAINHLVEMGIANPKAIAIGGEGFGAFMTANLLAHTDLFAAGIAINGLYNPSLTPFGFQTEERTFWQIPDTYNKMSPFSSADKLKTPLLLIHGQRGNLLQSESFYSALKGHGASTRLVTLPAEGTDYRAKESVLHMMWEMDKWLDKYLKE